MTRDQLLDAQYFIADKISKVNIGDFDQIDTDSEGHYIHADANEKRTVEGVEQASPYCIHCWYEH